MKRDLGSSLLRGASLLGLHVRCQVAFPRRPSRSPSFIPNVFHRVFHRTVLTLSTGMQTRNRTVLAPMSNERWVRSEGMPNS